MGRRQGAVQSAFSSHTSNLNSLKTQTILQVSAAVAARSVCALSFGKCKFHWGDEPCHVG